MISAQPQPRVLVSDLWNTSEHDADRDHPARPTRLVSRLPVTYKAGYDYVDGFLGDEDLELIEMRYQELQARMELQELFAKGLIGG